MNATTPQSIRVRLTPEECRALWELINAKSVHLSQQQADDRTWSRTLELITLRGLREKIQPGAVRHMTTAPTEPTQEDWKHVAELLMSELHRREVRCQAIDSRATNENSGPLLQEIG